MACGASFPVWPSIREIISSFWRSHFSASLVSMVFTERGMEIVVELVVVVVVVVVLVSVGVV